MAVIGNLSVSLTAQTQDFDTAMRRSSRNVGELRGSVTQAQGSISGLGAAFARLGAAVGGLALARTALQGVISSGVEAQRLTAVFTAISGSAQNAARQMDFVRTTADRMGQDVSETANAYRGFSAALRGTQLEGQQSQVIFTQIARGMTTLGATGSDLQGVFLALQQMISRGTVTAEDFNQVTERLPGALNIAARALGVTTAEFGRMREQGNVISTQFVPKFAAQLDKELGGGADAMSKSFSGAMARLGNALKDVGAQAADSGILTFLGGVVDKLAGIISKGPQAARELEHITKGLVQRDLAGLPGGPAQASNAEEQRLIALKRGIQRQQDVLREAETRYGPPKPLGPDTGPGNPYRDPRHTLAEMQRDYDALLARAQRTTQMREALELPESGGSNVAEQLKGLDKELADRVKMAEDSVTALGKRLPYASGKDVVEIRKKQLEELDKAIRDVETTMGRSPNITNLLGTGQGQNGLPAAPKGVDPTGWRQFAPKIIQQATARGLDPALALALTAQESGFNPIARSRAGAQGLMQLMPDTARRFGVQDALNPDENIRGGLDYLVFLSKRFGGNVPLTLAGYNAGEGAVARYGGVPPFRETRDFVTRVQAGQAALQGQLGAAAPGPGGSALETLRAQRAALADLIDEASADTQRAELRHTVLDELADRAKRLQDQLVNTQDDLVTTTGRLLDEANARLPAGDPVGEGVRRLLLGRAEALQAQQDQEQRDKILADIEREPIRFSPALETEDDRRRSHVEVALEEAQAVMQITDALAAERDQLTLTNEELLKQALARQHASEATTQFALELQRGNQVLQDASRFSGLVTDSLIDMATSGEVSISRLGQAFARMALQMVVDASGLRQSLTGLFQKGIQIAISSFGAASGGSAGLGVESGGNVGIGLGAEFARASGGPVNALHSYLVGEQGPELLVPRNDGYVLPHMATQSLMASMATMGEGRNVTVAGPLVAVYANDAGSFQRSRGEIEAAGARTLRGLQRGA